MNVDRVKERLFYMAVATVVTGCHSVNSQQEAPQQLQQTPVVDLRPALVKVPPTPTLRSNMGSAFDIIWDRLLDDSPILYGSLLGQSTGARGSEDHGFRESREEFLKDNGDVLPDSITFKNHIGEPLFQLLYGGEQGRRGFFSNAFALHTIRASICAPATEQSIGFYRRLSEDFKNGGEINKTNLRAMMRGATPDCNYYYDIQRYIGTPLPAEPGTIKG